MCEYESATITSSREEEGVLFCQCGAVSPQGYRAISKSEWRERKRQSLRSRPADRKKTQTTATSIAAGKLDEDLDFGGRCERGDRGISKKGHGSRGI